MVSLAQAEPTGMLVFAGPPSGWIKEYDLAGNFQRDLLEPREFASPQYGAFAPDGNLFVSSYTTGRVVKMDLAGNILGDFVASDGTLVGSTFLTVRGGELIVSGSTSGAIAVYDAHTGAYKRNLVQEGIMESPHTVHWLGSGEMLVTDIVANSIRRFAADGSYIDEFSTDPILTQPSGMEVTPDGLTLLVTNFTNGQVNMFDLATGAHLGQLFQAGTAADDLTYGPDGKLYVASYGSHAIYRYDFATGQAETFIGSGLRGPNSVLFIPSTGSAVVLALGAMSLARRGRERR